MDAGTGAFGYGGDPLKTVRGSLKNRQVPFTGISFEFQHRESIWTMWMILLLSFV